MLLRMPKLREVNMAMAVMYECNKNIAQGFKVLTSRGTGY